MVHLLGYDPKLLLVAGHPMTPLQLVFQVEDEGSESERTRPLDRGSPEIRAVIGNVDPGWSEVLAGSGVSAVPNVDPADKGGHERPSC